MGAGTSTFHQFDAEELAKYAAEHLKEDGEAVAAIIRREEVDGDLALSLRDMGEEALSDSDSVSDPGGALEAGRLGDLTAMATNYMADER